MPKRPAIFPFYSSNKANKKDPFSCLSLMHVWRPTIGARYSFAGFWWLNRTPARVERMGNVTAPSGQR